MQNCSELHSFENHLGVFSNFQTLIHLPHWDWYFNFLVQVITEDWWVLFLVCLLYYILHNKCLAVGYKTIKVNTVQTMPENSEGKKKQSEVKAITLFPYTCFASDVPLTFLCELRLVSNISWIQFSLLEWGQEQTERNSPGRGYKKHLILSIYMFCTLSQLPEIKSH